MAARRWPFAELAAHLPDVALAGTRDDTNGPEFPPHARAGLQVTDEGLPGTTGVFCRLTLPTRRSQLQLSPHGSGRAVECHGDAWNRISRRIDHLDGERKG
jgi:hypothetical protein